jgi:hypothetical protein
MTRNGKIARLPLTIRRQLNLRLQNGELAQDLLSWLDQLPEVQAILAARFAAKPIDQSNLWKQGVISTKKQDRIRQIMGIGEGCGLAAPESLLPTKTEPN